MQSIIRYAFDTSIQKHDLMGVDLSNYTQNKPYAVPFFQYLNRSAENVAINQTPGPEVRKTTKDRIIVLFVDKHLICRRARIRIVSYCLDIFIYRLCSTSTIAWLCFIGSQIS